MKHKFPPQSFIINVDLYDFYLLFSLNQKNNEFDAFLKTSLYARTYKKLKNSQILKDILKEKNAGHCWMPNRTQIIIIKIADRNNTLNTLAHEIFHAVNFMLEKAQIHYEKGEANESHAYLTGYIHGELHKKLNYDKERI